MAKTYAEIPGGMKLLVMGLGLCMASDRITVDGEPVRFMYRDEPDMEGDSGWRFTAGDESQDYMDDETHHGVFDVNVIANYDPDIIPHLKAPVGSAFERAAADEAFEAVTGFDPRA